MEAVNAIKQDCRPEAIEAAARHALNVAPLLQRYHALLRDSKLRRGWGAARGVWRGRGRHGAACLGGR
jgi:hypothetical protein